MISVFGRQAIELTKKGSTIQSVLLVLLGAVAQDFTWVAMMREKMSLQRHKAQQCSICHYNFTAMPVTLSIYVLFNVIFNGLYIYILHISYVKGVRCYVRPQQQH